MLVNDEDIFNSGVESPDSVDGVDDLDESLRTNAAGSAWVMFTVE